ncbi:MAG: type II toxin-antitoxin system VapC family toxin [Anaerolineae bacterium]|nr:type II toxin-antitoxin system VapC family toxin [Anaerolineae bacterium]
MKYLLDTHVFIWLDAASIQLSEPAHKIIADRSNILFLSLVSIWEMQIKHQLGKLALRTSLTEIIDNQQKTNGIYLLGITLPHVLTLTTLANHHRDPFDRLLIAQTRMEEMILITDDREISNYEVKTVW